MTRPILPRGIARGSVKDLGADFGFGTLTLADPDGIQLEFAAPRPD